MQNAKSKIHGIWKFSFVYFIDIMSISDTWPHFLLCTYILKRSNGPEGNEKKTHSKNIANSQSISCYYLASSDCALK